MNMPGVRGLGPVPAANVGSCNSFFILSLFYNLIFSMGFLPTENQVAFPEEGQLRQSRATQFTMRVWFLFVCLVWFLSVFP